MAPVVAGAIVLAGCADTTPAPAETLTVTASPSAAPTVTVTPSPEPVETETVRPSVYVPDGEFAIVLGEGATPEDAALAEAFVELALDPSAGPGGLPLAPDSVQLGILQRIFSTRTPAELRDPAAWLVGDGALYFESEGPFSAIDIVRSWVLDRERVEDVPIATGVFEVAVGKHDGCPYTIEGVPEGMESARQVWLAPVGDELSCAARWFAVDLFVQDGTVAAVTLALGSP